MALNKDIIKQLQQYKSALIRKGIQVEAFYLFGSYARGNQLPDSDIDVAVISSSFTGNRFYDSLNVAKIKQPINQQIEPIAFRPEDFNDNDPLVDQITHFGIKF